MGMFAESKRANYNFVSIQGGISNVIAVELTAASRVDSSSSVLRLNSLKMFFVSRCTESSREWDAMNTDKNQFARGYQFYSSLYYCCYSFDGNIESRI